jgi:hypothetical protein
MTSRRVLAVLGMLLTLTAQANGKLELREQNIELLARIQAAHGYSAAQMDALRALLLGSGHMGPGQPRHHRARRQS